LSAAIFCINFGREAALDISVFFWLFMLVERMVLITETPTVPQSWRNSCTDVVATPSKRYSTVFCTVRMKTGECAPRCELAARDEKQTDERNPLVFVGERGDNKAFCSMVKGHNHCL
jgi:hypothetical protein